MPPSLHSTCRIRKGGVLGGEEEQKNDEGGGLSFFYRGWPLDFRVVSPAALLRRPSKPGTGHGSNPPILAAPKENPLIAQACCLRSQIMLDVYRSSLAKPK